jgi:hypothetical protein
MSKRYRFAYIALTTDQAKEAVYVYKSDTVPTIQLNLNIRTFLQEVKSSYKNQSTQQSTDGYTYYVKVPLRYFSRVKELKIDPVIKKITVKVPISFPIKNPKLIPDLSDPSSIDILVKEDMRNSIDHMDDNSTDSDSVEFDNTGDEEPMSMESFCNGVFTW